MTQRRRFLAVAKLGAEVISEHFKKGVTNRKISGDIATFNAQYPKLAVRYYGAKDVFMLRISTNV